MQVGTNITPSTSSPARVVSRTNRTIAPPTGTLRRREQDHRDQRIEEHIKAWEQSGATARGRFTLELLWPLTLPPDPTPDLGRPWLPWSDSRGFGYPAVTLAVLSLTSSLTLPLDSRLDSRLLLDSRVAAYPAAVQSPLVSSVDSRVASVDSRGLFRSLQLTHRVSLGLSRSLQLTLQVSSVDSRAPVGALAASGVAGYPVVSSAKMCEMCAKFVWP